MANNNLWFDPVTPRALPGTNPGGTYDPYGTGGQTLAHLSDLNIGNSFTGVQGYGSAPMSYPVPTVSPIDYSGFPIVNMSTPQYSAPFVPYTPYTDFSSGYTGSTGSTFTPDPIASLPFYSDASVYSSDPYGLGSIDTYQYSGPLEGFGSTTVSDMMGSPGPPSDYAPFQPYISSTQEGPYSPTTSSPGEVTDNPFADPSWLPQQQSSTPSGGGTQSVSQGPLDIGSADQNYIPQVQSNIADAYGMSWGFDPVSGGYVPTGHSYMGVYASGGPFSGFGSGTGGVGPQYNSGGMAGIGGFGGGGAYATPYMHGGFDPFGGGTGGFMSVGGGFDVYQAHHALAVGEGEVSTKHGQLIEGPVVEPMTQFPTAYKWTLDPTVQSNIGNWSPTAWSNDPNAYIAPPTTGPNGQMIGALIGSYVNPKAK